MARRPRTADRSRPAGLARSTWLLLLVALLALLLRSLVVAPFGIPSESMLPQLMVGDYLIVEKWPYGWSRHSFPLSWPGFAGRIGGRAPARGDVVVFKNPADARSDYVKRVIGLPGDSVAVRGGALILNGSAVPRVRLADLRLPLSPNSPCPQGDGRAGTREREEYGSLACRYPRYRETLPGGRSYDVLALDDSPQADDTPVFHVPAGRYFLLGDNRDRSADSRFPAAVGGGIGLVPAEDLVGRAWRIVFSTDGAASWARPWTWWRAARPGRIGTRL